MKVLSSALLALVTVSAPAFASVTVSAPEGTKAIILDTNRTNGAVNVIAVAGDGSMMLIRQTSTEEIKGASIQKIGFYRQGDYTIQNEQGQNQVVGGMRYFRKHDEVHDLEGFQRDPSFSSSYGRFGQHNGNVEQASPDFVPVYPNYGPGVAPGYGPGYGPGPGFGPGPGLDQGIPLRR